MLRRHGQLRKPLQESWLQASSGLNSPWGSKNATHANQQFASTAEQREAIRLDGSYVSPSDVKVTQRVMTVRPPNLAAAAPAALPASPEQISKLVELLQNNRKVVVLTGAGCSTESNIPDYRGPHGAYTTGFTPMTHQQFMAAPETRCRYWARSFVGWLEFALAVPNSAHEGLSRLQRGGWVLDIITQNVDRLHHKAGSTSVTELHGTTHRVICMSCGTTSCRHEFQRTLSELNPAAAELAQSIVDASAARAEWKRAQRAGMAADSKVTSKYDTPVPVRRPDGDVEIQDAGKGFIVPPCPACGGILKPDVVLFGDNVPAERSKRVLQLASECDAMLVVGSSLMTWSAFRLARAAKDKGATVAIVNVGETRADVLADLKLEVLAGEAMMKLATEPSMLLPRI